ncbi:MAG: DMT family transporter [Rhodobacteraceae bacterium]|nr:MAG: DMT family transporter [Paracoccaceae bacterium]
MNTRIELDRTGFVSLTVLTVVLALNQVVIKYTNGGLQPVFQAGLRSTLALIPLLIWVALSRREIRFERSQVAAGLMLGGWFALEFLLLFTALDRTTVSRSAILFYSMPVWLAVAGHFLLPGERLTSVRLTGLALAMAGVIWALADRDAAGGDMLGDLMALAGSFCWAALALTVRLSSLKRASAETQLAWQLLVSAPILLGVALLGGPVLRDPTLLHWVGLGFQAVLVASLCFLWWFYLLARYKASAVGSFGFLTPVLSVVLGAVLLGERPGFEVVASLGLIIAGIALMNRKPRLPMT